MIAAGLPTGDPQFWIVTATVAAVAVLAVGRIVRSLRKEAETPCASCPKVQAMRPASPRLAPSSRLPILALVLALAPLGAGAETVERRAAAMGTTVRIEIEAGERVAGLALAESALRAIEETERRLSTWRPDSELSILDRAPVGAETALSAPTVAALAAAQRCAAETGGAFDPTVAPLVRVWGLRRGGRRPEPGEIDSARLEIGADRLRLDRAAGTARKLAPVAIDEGGFGKGAALDAALDAVARGADRARAALVDLGGQQAWSGAGPGTIELADPRRRSRAAVELVVPGPARGPLRGSIASSGNSERSIVVDGVRLGHLLDPKSGRPASDFGSVAVLDASALRADCLSTALYVLGPERGLAWLADHGGDAEAVFLVVEGDRLRVRMSSGLAGRVRPLAPEVVLEESTEPRTSSS